MVATICFSSCGQNVHLSQKRSVLNFRDNLSCLFIQYGPRDTNS